MTPLNSRHARLLAQTAFDEAAEFARDGHIAESIERAQAGVETLLTYPAELKPGEAIAISFATEPPALDPADVSAWRGYGPLS